MVADSLFAQLSAPDGLEGWKLVVPAPKTPEALITRARLEESHIAFIKCKRAHSWAKLCEEIREWRSERQERYNRAIQEWRDLCFSDSDLD